MLALSTVPIYEYQCHGCGELSEVMQKMSEDALTTCESCGGRLERLISATAFHLKGGGWYKDLYASAKPESATKSEGGGGEGGGGEGSGGDSSVSSGDGSGSSSDSSKSSGETKPAGDAKDAKAKPADSKPPKPAKKTSSKGRP